MKKKKIDLPVFGIDVIIYIEGTPEEGFHETKRIASRYGLKMTMTLKNFKAAGVSYTLPKEGNTKKLQHICMIFVNTESEVMKILGSLKARNITIPHEVSHTVEKITSKLGIDDGETSAYLTGYLCGELL